MTVRAMSIFIITIAITIPARLGAQDQHPMIFSEPSVVAMGAQHIETLWTGASGTWSDAPGNLGTISTHIECYKKFSFCAWADAGDQGGPLIFSTLDILRWDDAELVAIDSTPPCQVNQIRFDFKTKQVSITETPKGDVKYRCPKGNKSTTAYLAGLKDELKRLEQKPQTRK